MGEDDSRDGRVLIELERLADGLRVLVAPPLPLEIGGLPESARRLQLSRALQEPADEVEIRTARGTLDVRGGGATSGFRFHEDNAPSQSVLGEAAKWWGELRRGRLASPCSVMPPFESGPR
jgi:hypothetical protein